MRSLLARNGKLEFITDHPDPRRRSGEALVRVRMAGVCNTDIEILKGYMGFQGVLGHEFVGIVEEADSPGLVGKRVVGEINCGCGACEACRRGMERHCAERTVLGIFRRDGAFADLLTLPERNLHLVPDEVPDEEAVFTEPLAAAFEILDQVPIKGSDRVAVLGDGKLGLLVAQVIATTGCRLVTLGKHASKLAILSRLGLRAEAAALNTEHNFDCVVDCTGSEAGLEAACDRTRPRGTVVLKSTVAGRSAIHLSGIVIHELTIVGSRCGLFAPAIEALRAKQVRTAPLVGARYPFSRAMEAMEKALERGMLKVLLEM